MKDSYIDYAMSVIASRAPVSYTHLDVYKRQEQGLEVQGLSDTSAETICVAARNEIGQEEYSPAKE